MRGKGFAGLNPRSERGHDAHGRAWTGAACFSSFVASASPGLSARARSASCAAALVLLDQIGLASAVRFGRLPLQRS